MTRWATAAELRERMTAAFQLYLDAVTDEAGREGTDLRRARKVTAARMREYLALLRRFEKARDRQERFLRKRTDR